MATYFMVELVRHEKNNSDWFLWNSEFVDNKPAVKYQFYGVFHNTTQDVL